jgi:hypothetical protein
MNPLFHWQAEAELRARSGRQSRPRLVARWREARRDRRRG